MHSADLHDYSVFGLKLHSAIELPELPGSLGSGTPDVVIKTGQVPASGLPVGIHRQGDIIILIVESVGRFLITGGREILVDADVAVPPKNVRLYLLGTAFGILLHQRGMLPLHANAIDIGGKAYAFMGESGAGKSTLAAWFHDHGQTVIIDASSMSPSRDVRVLNGVTQTLLGVAGFVFLQWSPSGRRAFARHGSHPMFSLSLTRSLIYARLQSP